MATNDDISVRVQWKDEDLIDGQPVGPLVVTIDGTRDDRESRWTTRQEAEAVADWFGVTLEVF